MVAITGSELIDWVEETTRRWHSLIATHPEILQFPCDIRETNNVAQLLQHIVAVELRYAELLNGLTQTPYESIPFDSADAIFATHDKAMSMLRPLLENANDFWETVLEMQTRSAGIFRATRRTTLVHSLTHSIRHYAQLATIARHHGVAPNWHMDYIMMGLIK